MKAQNVHENVHSGFVHSDRPGRVIADSRYGTTRSGTEKRVADAGDGEEGRGRDVSERGAEELAPGTVARRRS